MIKQNGQTLETEGSINMVISEAAALLNYIPKAFAKQIMEKGSPGNKTEDEIENEIRRNIISGAELYCLVDKGMSPEEAMKVLDIDGTIMRVDGEEEKDEEKTK